MTHVRVIRHTQAPGESRALGYPPLKVIIGSMNTSAAIFAGGLALMVLPTLVVGNELLILAGFATAVGLWFLAHRHGRLRGFVDANRDEVDDRVEPEHVDT